MPLVSIDTPQKQKELVPDFDKIFQNSGTSPHFAPLGGCIFAEGGALLNGMKLCKPFSHTSRRMLTGADPLK